MKILSFTILSFFISASVWANAGTPSVSAKKAEEITKKCNEIWDKRKDKPYIDEWTKNNKDPWLCPCTLTSIPQNQKLSQDVLKGKYRSKCVQEKVGTLTASQQTGKILNSKNEEPNTEFNVGFDGEGHTINKPKLNCCLSGQICNLSKDLQSCNELSNSIVAGTPIVSELTEVSYIALYSKMVNTEGFAKIVGTKKHCENDCFTKGRVFYRKQNNIAKITKEAKDSLRHWVSNQKIKRALKKIKKIRNIASTYELVNGLEIDSSASICNVNSWDSFTQDTFSRKKCADLRSKISPREFEELLKHRRYGGINVHSNRENIQNSGLWLTQNIKEVKQENYCRKISGILQAEEGAALSVDRKTVRTMYRYLDEYIEAKKDIIGKKCKDPTGFGNPLKFMKRSSDIAGNNELMIKFNNIALTAAVRKVDLRVIMTNPKAFCDYFSEVQKYKLPDGMGSKTEAYIELSGVSKEEIKKIKKDRYYSLLGNSCEKTKEKLVDVLCEGPDYKLDDADIKKYAPSFWKERINNLNNKTELYKLEEVACSIRSGLSDEKDERDGKDLAKREVHIDRMITHSNQTLKDRLKAYENGSKLCDDKKDQQRLKELETVSLANVEEGVYFHGSNGAVSINQKRVKTIGKKRDQKYNSSLGGDISGNRFAVSDASRDIVHGDSEAIVKVVVERDENGSVIYDNSEAIVKAVVERDENGDAITVESVKKKSFLGKMSDSVVSGAKGFVSGVGNAFQGAAATREQDVQKAIVDNPRLMGDFNSVASKVASKTGGDESSSAENIVDYLSGETPKDPEFLKQVAENTKLKEEIDSLKKKIDIHTELKKSKESLSDADKRIADLEEKLIKKHSSKAVKKSVTAASSQVSTQRNAPSELIPTSLQTLSSNTGDSETAEISRAAVKKASEKASSGTSGRSIASTAPIAVQNMLTLTAAEVNSDSFGFTVNQGRLFLRSNNTENLYPFQASDIKVSGDDVFVNMSGNQVKLEGAQKEQVLAFINGETFEREIKEELKKLKTEKVKLSEKIEKQETEYFAFMGESSRLGQEN